MDKCLKKIIISAVFSVAVLFISMLNVNAVTITETTKNDEYGTIKDNTIIIGITKFEAGEILTASKAVQAAYDDYKLNGRSSEYVAPEIYYYISGVWMHIDRNNNATLVEDQDTIDKLNTQDIYYVNNEEKMLEVEYEINTRDGYEVFFETDEPLKDSKIKYENGVLKIPATVAEVYVIEKEKATGNTQILGVLYKDSSNSTEFNTPTAEVSSLEELKEALANSEINTIELKNNIDGLTETLVVEQSVTINGNGNTITANENVNIFQVSGTDTILIVNNAKLVTTGSGVAVRIGDKNLGTDKNLKAIIGSDVEITSKWFGVAVFGENSSVDVYGKINITDDGYGISGNGLASYAGKTTINIKEGAEITAPNGYALYIPQDGTVNIEGGNLEGASVVGLKAGTLNVTGGILTAKGNKVALPSATYDGKTPTGDVIAVEVNNDYIGGQIDRNINISVTGGTLVSNNAYIIREVNVDSSDIEIEVTGNYAVKISSAENVNIYGDSEPEVTNANELKSAILNPEITELNLTESLELTETLIADHSITINGNGNTITGAENKNLFHVMGTDATLTIDDIKLVTNGSGAAVKVGEQNLEDGKTLKAVIGENVEITSKYYGVTVFGKNSTVDFYGTVEIAEDGYGIAGNANPNTGNTIINVKEGSVIKAPNGYALYLPQDGIANIEGGELTGASVIGIKAGKLNITGGTLTATGDYVVLPAPSYDGKTPTGDVIAVEVNDSYEGGRTNKNIVIDITGGTLASNNAYIIREVNVDSSDIEIEVTGLYSAKQVLDTNVNSYVVE